MTLKSDIEDPKSFLKRDLMIDIKGFKLTDLKELLEGLSEKSEHSHYYKENIINILQAFNRNLISDFNELINDDYFVEKNHDHIEILKKEFVKL